MLCMRVSKTFAKITNKTMFSALHSLTLYSTFGHRCAKNVIYSH